MVPPTAKLPCRAIASERGSTVAHAVIMNSASRSVGETNCLGSMNIPGQGDAARALGARLTAR